MPYLVDGSNLGGRLGGAAGARDAAGVVRRLLPWARRRREEVVVVFDGPERPEVAASYGALRVVWSGAASADDRIVAMIGASPGRWIVVTGDRELGRRCRELGSRLLAPTELATRAAKARRAGPKSSRAAEESAGKPPPHAEEREHWKKIFDPDS